MKRVNAVADDLDLFLRVNGLGGALADAATVFVDGDLNLPFPIEEAVGLAVCAAIRRPPFGTRRKLADFLSVHSQLLL